MADAGQTPSTDQTLADQPLEDRTDMVDKSRVERHAPGGLGPTRHVVLVGHHIRMEKKQIEPRQSEASKAPFDRLPQAGFDLFAGWIAETAFAGDLHAIRQVAPEGFADDLFGFAIAVARRQVDQVDPSSYCCAHGRDAFVERCFTPHHADAAAAQRQRRDRPKLTEAILPHECRLRDTDHNSQQA